MRVLTKKRAAVGRPISWWLVAALFAASGPFGGPLLATDPPGTSAAERFGVSGFVEVIVTVRDLEPLTTLFTGVGGYEVRAEGPLSHTLAERWSRGGGRTRRPAKPPPHGRGALRAEARI